MDSTNPYHPPAIEDCLEEQEFPIACCPHCGEPATFWRHAWQVKPFYYHCPDCDETVRIVAPYQVTTFFVIVIIALGIGAATIAGGGLILFDFWKSMLSIAIGLPTLIVFGIVAEVLQFWYLQRWGKFVVKAKAK